VDDPHPLARYVTATVDVDPDGTEPTFQTFYQSALAGAHFVGTA
jgi:hypothetical protein